MVDRGRSRGVGDDGFAATRAARSALPAYERSDETVLRSALVVESPTREFYRSVVRWGRLRRHRRAARSGYCRWSSAPEGVRMHSKYTRCITRSILNTLSARRASNPLLRSLCAVPMSEGGEASHALSRDPTSDDGFRNLRTVGRLRSLRRMSRLNVRPAHVRVSYMATIRDTPPSKKRPGGWSRRGITPRRTPRAHARVSYMAAIRYGGDPRHPPPSKKRPGGWSRPGHHSGDATPIACANPPTVLYESEPATPGR
jgi:hypothetical protein